MDQMHKVLITVGTTQFDQLIQYTSSKYFMELLRINGFGDVSMTYQIGANGKVIPEKGNYFRLSDNIQQVYQSHSIIFTHGGAGTLLYCLRNGLPGRKIIAIANDTLAGNHQTELVSKLHKEGYILGFNSVKELKENESKMIQFLKGRIEMKQYKKVESCVMNNLIFDKFQ